MPCLAAPRLPNVSVALAILLPTLSFSAPSLGVNFCCALETPPIPGFPIVLPLGVITGVALILAPVMNAIMIAIDRVNELLDSLTVSCPLD